jgi:hypothetical protein
MDRLHEFTSKLACGTTIVVEQVEGGSNLMIPATLEAVSTAFACSLVLLVIENSMSVLGPGYHMQSYTVRYGVAE